MSQAKSFSITKQEVFAAWREVRANGGAAGVDAESITAFEADWKNNLYKLWNRLSSGSYFPPPVREVEIPKPTGGIRKLGVPTVADRIAQTVVRRRWEPAIDPLFHVDSYAYRPGKSALDAITTVRRRSWAYDWVLEFDVEKAFDALDHQLMMKAVAHHCTCPWIRLYIKRWLQAPVQCVDGSLMARERGTPQGGVISPLLFNLYLHYAHDVWMQRHSPATPFVRYADDGVVHCRTLDEATALHDALAARLGQCGLRLHPAKTRIVYCKDANRGGDYACTAFDFLGYTFRRRLAKGREGQYFMSFAPAISRTSAKRVRSRMRDWSIARWTDATPRDIAKQVNPALRGWWNYFGRHFSSLFKRLLAHFNCILLKWVGRKFKRFRHRRQRARQWLAAFARRNRSLFFHWQLGVMPAAEQ